MCVCVLVTEWVWLALYEVRAVWDGETAGL